MFLEPVIYAILVEEPFRKHWSSKMEVWNRFYNCF